MTTTQEQAMALDEMRVPLAYQPTTTTGVGAARTAAAPETDKTSNAVLQARVAALEQGDSFAATQTAVQQVQADCLRQLREIRTALGSSTTTTTTTSAPAADTLALERKVAKLEYRVQHLVSGIESLYEKQNTANVGSS